MIVHIPMNNRGYNPVSLTSCMCKMFERMILDKLLDLFDDNISNDLYGFIKKKRQLIVL